MMQCFFLQRESWGPTYFSVQAAVAGRKVVEFVAVSSQFDADARAVVRHTRRRRGARTARID